MLQGITIIIVVGLNLGRYKKCAVGSLGMSNGTSNANESRMFWLLCGGKVNNSPHPLHQPGTPAY